MSMALENYKPDKAEQIKTKQHVQKQAKSYGLTEAQANHLALGPRRLPGNETIDITARQQLRQLLS
jgi:hypothetical protein